jgi:hypothetical protein
MESSIAQSIHKGFEKEKWEIKGYFYNYKCYIYLYFNRQSKKLGLLGKGMAVPLPKTFSGNWMRFNRSYMISIGRMPNLLVTWNSG